ncbi:MAG: 2-dehydro-3-deoxygalactonokinase [Pseudomonadota bacterium]
MKDVVDHTAPSWIAVDWGTSRFRAFAVGPRGQIIGRTVSDTGMSRLTPEQFEPELLSKIEHWMSKAPVTVLACGMVGARQGWREVPYTALPTDLSTLRPVSIPTKDPRLHVAIVPGLSQHSPADVMRGEEMQIAGFLSQNPDFSGTLCLPGTHSKWCKIERGALTYFRTVMVGEIFALLCEHSLLRHSVGEGWDENVFRTSVADVALHGEDPLLALFSIRAGGLLTSNQETAATARLSGFLIGAELLAARKAFPAPEVTLIGSKEMCGRYASALETIGCQARMFDGSELVVAGLAQIARATLPDVC